VRSALSFHPLGSFGHPRAVLVGDLLLDEVFDDGR
jgi:hypothetical protein